MRLTDHQVGKHDLRCDDFPHPAAVSGNAQQPLRALESDVEERVVTVPRELKRALAEDRSLRQWFDKMNYSMRRYISEWIADVKSGEARMRRAEQIAERLLATMEAERELPPILQIAFAHNPRAREGWERMSAARRRGHLLGIFYYRNPEARGRRVEKALQDAVQVAEKKATKIIRRRRK